MDDNNQTHGGYENGQDWLDDLAVESYLLNKVEIPKSKEGAS
jgi:hypothetical protein